MDNETEELVSRISWDNLAPVSGSKELGEMYISLICLLPFLIIQFFLALVMITFFGLMPIYIFLELPIDWFTTKAVS